MAQHRRVRREHKSAERGAAIVEFGLIAIVWVPLLLGAVTLGFDLIRAIQSSQLSRDAGHMSAYGVDFRLARNKPLLASLAAPLSVTDGGGDGAIVLSTVTLVTAADCTNQQLTGCANTGHYVFTSIYSFGNPAPDVTRTTLGSPPSDYLVGAKVIGIKDYLTMPELRADSLANVLTFIPNVSGQAAYISEVTLRPTMTFTSFVGGQGSYARSIF